MQAGDTGNAGTAGQRGHLRRDVIRGGRVPGAQAGRRDGQRLYRGDTAGRRLEVPEHGLLEPEPACLTSLVRYSFVGESVFRESNLLLQAQLVRGIRFQLIVKLRTASHG